MGWELLAYECVVLGHLVVAVVFGLLEFGLK